MKKFYYITTPIYYVNDRPHIGHAYTSLSADILSRFKNLDGYETIFLTGTDEHGQKVEKSAIAKNKTPQEFVNEVSVFFKELTPLLNLSNNDFIRTTEERHKKAVQHLWQTLEDNSCIYLDKYSGWYALRDECFYAEAELTTKEDGTKLAPSGATVEWLEQDSYFFKLSSFQDKLLDFYAKNPNFISPKSRYNEVVSFVKSGLKDLSISRDNFNWGIPVPNNNKHVIYVWLDALTNYISALGYPAKTEQLQNYWEQAIHVVGKDIIRFHAVFWPAFLMGANLPLPKKIFAHGWWLNEGEKISKSLGNAIDPKQLIDKYGLDNIRYFLFKEISFGSDGDISHNNIVSRINNELANEYGNLLQRTISILNKSFDSTLVNVKLSEKQTEIINDTNHTLEKCRNYIDNQDLLNYIDCVMQLIKYGNFYINEMAPWKLIKAEQHEEALSVLYVVCEILRRVSLLMQPVMPSSAKKILDQLNINETKRSFIDFNSLIENNHVVNAPVIVFEKYIDSNDNS